MPLRQDDPSLNYDGSWGDASEGWPKISFSSAEEAREAYYHAWRHVKVPYGSYVLMEKDLRLETEAQKQSVEAYLAALKERREKDEETS